MHRKKEARYDHEEIVETIAERINEHWGDQHAAHAKAKGEYGNTPTPQAAGEGHTETVRKDVPAPPPPRPRGHIKLFGRSTQTSSHDSGDGHSAKRTQQQAAPGDGGRRFTRPHGKRVPMSSRCRRNHRKRRPSNDQKAVRSRDSANGTRFPSPTKGARHSPVLGQLHEKCHQPQVGKSTDATVQAFARALQVDSWLAETGTQTANTALRRWFWQKWRDEADRRKGFR